MKAWNYIVLIHRQLNVLHKTTLSIINPFPHIDTFRRIYAADHFWKHWDKRRNCSIFFSNSTFIYREFPCFCHSGTSIVKKILVVLWFLHDGFQSRLLKICCMRERVKMTFNVKEAVDSWKHSVFSNLCLCDYFMYLSENGLITHHMMGELLLY